MPIGMEFEGITFSELALADRPIHAATLGRIFTSWSLIEASVASLLGLMMHNDHRAALALLASFKTNSARINAVRKTGKEVLEASLFEDFEKVMKDVLSYAEERNSIAHGVWGSCKAEPEIVYRMSIESFTRSVIVVNHMSADKALTELTAVRSTFAKFTADELNQIEQRGREMLQRVMKETTKKAYSLALERQEKAN